MSGLVQAVGKLDGQSNRCIIKMFQDHGDIDM